MKLAQHKPIQKTTIVVYRITLSVSMLLLYALLSATTLTGCSSTSGNKTFIMPESDTNSTAHGAAFTGSAMFLRKPMPSHSDWQPQAFYYKVCEQATAATYYSRTSYSCNER